MENTVDDRLDWAEAQEQRLLDAAVARAGALGWSAGLVRAAGEACGLSRGDVELLLPHGPRDLAALLSHRHDARALAVLGSAEGLKIRQRIQKGVEARMEAGAADLEACRRCAGFLALPTNAALGLELAWASADAIWRWAGDTATDENHYSKRAILSGILVPALTMRWFDGQAAAQAFVAARIDDVMAFETWKAGVARHRPLRKVVEALGRMRYRAGAS